MTSAAEAALHVEQSGGTMEYHELDHTADVGIRAFGTSLEELMLNAARGMSAIILDPRPGIEPDRSDFIDVEAPRAEDLLHTWLSELLFLHAVHRSCPVSFEVQECTEHALRVRVRSAQMTETMVRDATEIKAVTWHGLAVRQGPGGWEAEVIFDT